MKALETNLNEILKKMRGQRMNKEQKSFLSHLQEKVKNRQITVKEAKRLWNKKYNVWKGEA